LTSALTLGAEDAALTAGAALDAGGIGKGIALDAIANLFREQGARAAFLDFGGSSQLALGAPPESPSGWKVAVAGAETGTLLGVLHLRDAALSTSRASAPGNPAGPIVDPRDAVPVPPPRLATVLAPDATTADAWSTALVVLGRDGLRRAEEAGLEALYEDRGGVVRTKEFPLRGSSD
jgi:thiamine biosynthesis lipoprotein